MALQFSLTNGLHDRFVSWRACSPSPPHHFTSMAIVFTLSQTVWRSASLTHAIALAAFFAANAACAATCPGNVGALNPTPSSEFLTHGDGTVTHITTGLMWKQCNEGLTGTSCSVGSATPMLWQDALTTAKNSTFAAYTDWRLPNKHELESLIDHRCFSPSINDNIFPGTAAYYTWTSTTVSSDVFSAWVVYFRYGNSFLYVKSLGDAVVRLVRSGQSFDALAPPPPILNLDVSDSSTRFAPDTAGALLLRYLLGLRDSALTVGALGANPQRSAAEIAAHISANLSAFDVDGDGAVLTTTDGLMILRRLVGLSGTALTTGAKNSVRSDDDIAAAIDALMR